ncbi:MAG: hypothetical protein QUV02_00065 [Maricaulis sp.]|uniref:hypothetical protein n=1 Tax=Maricaulis sp. TaxID=1486257 RepID=UPI00261D6C59|nr:hypothetical protein [Maricaulis sp.]MDM7982816.1 hypothetical protein [Maricaulis sp.]
MRTFLTYVLAASAAALSGASALASSCEPIGVSDAEVNAARDRAIAFALDADVLAYGRLNGARYPVQGVCDSGGNTTGLNGFQEILEIFEVEEVVRGREIQTALLHTGWMSRLGPDCELELMSSSTFALGDHQSDRMLMALTDSGQGAYSSQGHCLFLQFFEQDVIRAVTRDAGEQG